MDGVGDTPLHVEDILLTPSQVAEVRTVFRRELKQGLSSDEGERKKSSLLMEMTFVDHLCNRQEEGTFLAVDLGGTNLRVLYLTMRQGTIVTLENFPMTIPYDVLHGPAEGVFALIAQVLNQVVLEKGLSTMPRLSVGFTFSFPMTQLCLNKSFLNTWTKSFKCTSGVGQEVVCLLETAMASHPSLALTSVVAVLNDTTGTLVAGSYADPKCRIGVILGTGSNAAYFEKVEHIKRVSPSAINGDHAVIDVEWGAFGDNHSLDFFKLPEDFQVDQASNHAGSFTFEKMFAGLYMGELVRCLLKRYIAGGQLSCSLSDSLTNNAWTLPASFVSTMVKVMHDTSAAVDVCSREGIHVSPHDAGMIGRLCYTIMHRAAQVLGAVLVELILQMELPEKELSIAFDGSVYKHNPVLRKNLMMEINRQIPDHKVSFVNAEDGSGRGAGLLAAVVEWCRCNEVAN